MSPKKDFYGEKVAMVATYTWREEKVVIYRTTGDTEAQKTILCHPSGHVVHRNLPW